jgi:glycosyltransferase involved in cell wall biosynthesis
MIQKKQVRTKISVLHLLLNLEVGGAEVLLLHIIRALGTEHYKHFVYYINNDGPIREKLEALGVHVYRGERRASIIRPIRYTRSLMYLVSDLLRLIRTNQIQIIQSHLGEPNQLAVLISKLSGVPVFPTVHNPMAFLDKRSCLNFKLHLVRLANLIIYRLADLVLVVSIETKEVVQRAFHLNDSRIMLLKNGIVFNYSSGENPNSNEEFKSSTNKLKLIAVGRLVYQKSFDTLFLAMSELVNQGFEDFILLVAGEGEDRISLEKLIQKLKLSNQIKLLGLRHDIIRLMTAADVFIIPSRYEGLSLAMIEAMACGLPIIASDARGLRDYITNEQNGLLFPVRDYKALAACILRLATNKELRDRLSLGARKSFETEYDMRKNVKPLDMLFRKHASTR